MSLSGDLGYGIALGSDGRLLRPYAAYLDGAWRTGLDLEGAWRMRLEFAGARSSSGELRVAVPDGVGVKLRVERGARSAPETQ